MVGTDAIWSAISAFFASILSSSISYPIYTFYTRYASATNHNTKFLNHLSYGLCNIYSGYLMYCVATVWSQTIYYYFYSLLSTIVYIPPSFISAIISVLLSNPLWVLNSKLSTSLYSISYLVSSMKVLDYYSGLIPSLILTINPTITYIIYEYIIIMLPSSGYSVVFSSALCKFIASFLTYPLVYIKVNNQINPSNIITRWNQAGIVGLYHGIWSKLLHSLLTFVLLVYFQYLIYNILN